MIGIGAGGGMPGQPNFFVVGAAKAGTTSLYHYLREHPQIYMSPIKEPCYFASEVRPGSFDAAYRDEARRSVEATREYLSGPMDQPRFGGIVSEREDYLKLFRNVTCEKAIGEASVCYLWSPTAPLNIAARIPDARIIIILRDPADRAFSQYLDLLTAGRTLLSFRECIHRAMSQPNRQFQTLHPFLEYGDYHDQVKRYLDLFPKANVRIYSYDSYGGQISRILPDIFKFLEVDQEFLPDLSRQYRTPRVPRLYKLSYYLKRSGLWQPIRRSIPPPIRRRLRNAALRPRQSLVMDPEDRRMLVDYYRDDIRKLSILLEREFSSWLELRDQ